MAETNYDPSKLFVGTRLIKESNEAGSPIVDDSGEWKGGVVLIDLYDTKTSENVASKSIPVTRRKYEVFREDFNELSVKDVVEEYFSGVKLREASQTELQKEADRSKAETELREAKRRIAELEEEAKRREELDENSFNVLPVGSPDEEASNPEQEFSNEEMLEKGASAVGSGKDDAQNPEQVATNVGEDKSKGKTKAEKESPTNTRKTNVEPVKE